MSFDWKAVVKTVAPGLATALGGPLAGLAVTAIGEALGVSEPTQEKIQQALAGATPDDLLKIKAAEQTFQVKMRELDVDLVRIGVSDRDSARQREAATKDTLTPRFLAAVVVITWGVVQWRILNHSIPEDMRELVMRVLGTLDAALLVVLYYYFGGSHTPSTVVNGERRGR